MSLPFETKVNVIFFMWRCYQFRSDVINNCYITVLNLMFFNAYNIFHPKSTLQKVCQLSPAGWFNALVITLNDTACRWKSFTDWQGFIGAPGALFWEEKCYAWKESMSRLHLESGIKRGGNKRCFMGVFQAIVSCCYLAPSVCDNNGR